MKTSYRWTRQTVAAAALLATLGAGARALAGTDGQPPAKKKFSFLIPVDTALDEKPARAVRTSSVKPKAAAAAVPAVPENAVPVAAPSGAATPTAPAVVEAKPVVASAQYRERFAQGLSRAIAGDTKSSLVILNSLKNQSLPADERDRLMLAIGRVQYQAGDDVGAIESYNQVRRGGASYLEALEERSWANLRLGRPQEALASLKTILTPIYQDRVRSEPYFMTALAELRVCDYRSVLRTIDLFKTRFRTRVTGWENSIDSSDKVRLKEAGDTIQKLNLVEAEAIQRLYMDESGKPMAGSPPKITKESNQLTFPMDPEMDQKEVWLDEVDDYRVTVKGCPAPTPLSVGRVAKKEGSL